MQDEGTEVRDLSSINLLLTLRRHSADCMRGIPQGCGQNDQLVFEAGPHALAHELVVEIEDKN